MQILPPHEVDTFTNKAYLSDISSHVKPQKDSLENSDILHDVHRNVWWLCFWTKQFVRKFQFIVKAQILVDCKFNRYIWFGISAQLYSLTLSNSSHVNVKLRYWIGDVAYLSVCGDDDLSQVVVHGGHGLTNTVQSHVHLPFHSVAVGKQTHQLHYDLWSKKKQQDNKFS